MSLFNEDELLSPTIESVAAMAIPVELDNRNEPGYIESIIPALPSIRAETEHTLTVKEGITIHCLTGATLKLQELLCASNKAVRDSKVQELKKDGYWDPMYVVHEDGINWVVKGDETYHALVQILREDKTVAAIEFPVVQIEGVSLMDAEAYFKDGHTLFTIRIADDVMRTKIRDMLNQMAGVFVE